MAAEQSYLLGAKELFYARSTVKAERARAAHKILCAVLIPPTGKSSGTTLGVPSEALLHLHDASSTHRFPRYSTATWREGDDTKRAPS